MFQTHLPRRRLAPAGGISLDFTSMCEIVNALGRPSFEECLLRSIANQVSCSHLTAFSFGDGSRPKQIVAANFGRARAARDVGARYLERYWDLDPLNTHRGRSRVVSRLLVDDIHDVEYRRDCYESVDLIERLSVVNSERFQSVRLNFYRNRYQGQFSDDERRTIEEWATFLFAALEKHQLLAMPQGESEHGAFADRLRTIAPQLSPREVDICIDIVLGHTSDSIAAKRHLSVNTVLTHRRHAYAKLCISSQSELSRLVLRPGGPHLDS